MRQIFSVRFFAAVGAVAGLLFLLTTVRAAGRVIDDGADHDPTPVIRRIDLVDQIAAASNPEIEIVDGVTAATTDLTLDPSRRLTIAPGTPGIDYCHRLAEPGACAIVADLLGEAVVWFALVPMGDEGRGVALPAVDMLEEFGIAQLVNGWQLPHAPAFDRRCGDEVFESYRQFKQVFGDDFTTLYDLDQRRLTAVVCRERVAYAPAPERRPFS